MNKPIVDVDNPQFKPSIDPIASHSRIANFYKFRPPYINEFFLEASRKLALSNNSVMLDLCCGRGELASRFAAFAKEVVAVDGSREMLAHKIINAKVKYHLLDINQEDLSSLKKVDIVVIGSAIHWVKKAAVQKLVDNHLSNNGKFLISHTLLRLDEQPYFASLQDLNKAFGRNPTSNVDLWGTEKMGKCGYQRLDGIRFVRSVSFDLEYLLHNQLSYAYDTFFENTMSNLDHYKKEFTKVISPYLEHGKLSAKLVNWGVIYAPAAK